MFHKVPGSWIGGNLKDENPMTANTKVKGGGLGVCGGGKSVDVALVGDLDKDADAYKALEALERRLEDEVDADFFDDPKKFRTLHRVIDVLGAQLLDDEGGAGGGGKLIPANTRSPPRRGAADCRSQNRPSAPKCRLILPFRSLLEGSKILRFLDVFSGRPKLEKIRT